MARYGIPIVLVGHFLAREIERHNAGEGGQGEERLEPCGIEPPRQTNRRGTETLRPEMNQFFP